MIGLVLWYNPEPGVGMVWCEDQGPLAFLGPEVTIPGEGVTLHCGDQLVFSFEVRDGVRYVRDILSLALGDGGQDPREIIAGYHQAQEDDRNLRVVA